MITPDQLRAARSMLDLSQDKLVEATGIAKNTISNAEKGKHTTATETIEKLRFFYETSGLEFTEYDGVRKKPSGNRVLTGKTGFTEMYEDFWQGIKDQGGDIWIHNGESEHVINALGAEYVEMHKARMSRIKGHFNFRITVKAGDETDFGSDYAEYRRLPEDTFVPLTTFVYASKVAIVDFSGDINILIIDNAMNAQKERVLLDLLWETLE